VLFFLCPPYFLRLTFAPLLPNPIHHQMLPGIINLIGVNIALARRNLANHGARQNPSMIPHIFV
jgi:hypothetical protein